MKKHLFVIAAICVLVGSSCQKTEQADLSPDNFEATSISTRSGSIISGPTSISKNGSAIYQVTCPANYSAAWGCHDPYVQLNLFPDSRSVEVVANDLEGWITLEVSIYDENGRLFDTGSLDIYIQGSNGGPAIDPNLGGGGGEIGEPNPGDLI